MKVSIEYMVQEVSERVRKIQDKIAELEEKEDVKLYKQMLRELGSEKKN